MPNHPYYGDLARSGLLPRHVQARPLTRKQMAELTSNLYHVVGYILPYFNIDGKELRYFRVRLLEQPDTWYGKKKWPKYWQPSRSLPRLYLCPTVKNWRNLLADPTIPLLFTEGEKKVARACAEDILKYLPIGLGGIWSWQSSDHAIGLLQDFDDIAYKGYDADGAAIIRLIYLLLDSDMRYNPQGLLAFRRLARKLTDRGATVYTGIVPGEGKVGLDDWLEAGHTIDEIPWDRFTENDVLHDFNLKCAYIRELTAYYIVEDSLLVKSEIAKEHFATHKLTVKTDKGVREKPLFEVWRNWHGRREHKIFLYDPSMEPGPIAEQNGYNQYPGLAVTPEEGDVEPFLQLVDLLTKDEQEMRCWLLQWLAYPLQHMGTKLATALLIYGAKQGTGKTLLAEVMRAIYGKNYGTLSALELNSSFTNWGAFKQFILGDEIIATNDNKRNHVDVIKSLITRTTINVNQKYVRPYTVNDYANYFFTSNQPTPIYVDAFDRRIAIIRCEADPKSGQFYDTLAKWLRCDGAARVLHYLLHKVDTRTFSPYAPAPSSAGKEIVRELSYSDFEDRLRLLDLVTLIENSALLTAMRDFVSIRELAKLLQELWACPVAFARLGKAVHKLGYVTRYVQWERTTGKQFGQSYVLLKNADTWRTARVAVFRAEYEKYLEREGRQVPLGY